MSDEGHTERLEAALADRYDLNNGSNPRDLSFSVNYDASRLSREFVYVSARAAASRDLIWILSWPETIRGMTNLR